MDLRLVASGVHILEFEVCQAYIWEWERGLTLVDTGIAGSEGSILSAISSLGRVPNDVTEILLTHFHADHCGAAAALAARTGAVVLAHAADAPVIQGHQAPTPPNLTDQEKPFAEAVIAKVPPAPPVQVDRTVDEGDKTQGGGVIVSVPGHTPGSIALLLPQIGVLFTGDTVASVNGEPILGPFNVNQEQARQSVVKQAALDFQIACVGHGAPLLDNAQSRLRQLAARL